LTGDGAALGLSGSYEGQNDVIDFGRCSPI
jgi:hypothetical protein